MAHVKLFLFSLPGIQTFQCGVGDICSAYERADALEMKCLDSELQAEVVGGDAANFTWRMIDVYMSISINILLKSLMQACFSPTATENINRKTTKQPYPFNSQYSGAVKQTLSFESVLHRLAKPSLSWCSYHFKNIKML